VHRKLEESKSKFEREYNDILEQKEHDIRDLTKRHDDLRHQKDNQDKQNMEAMKSMEMEHLTEVEDLQAVYEKKLYIEQSNYLKLDQEKSEMVNYYKDKIEELRK